MIFDVGLHIRMGDACGPQAQQQPLRHCLRSLNQALEKLPAAPGPRVVFLATDSEEVVRQARKASENFTFHWLALDRLKYDSSEHEVIELATAKRGNMVSVLLEILLELTLLAHARTIVGSMSGNVPRLALQLQRGVALDQAGYVSLDGGDWCIDSRCISVRGG